MKEYCLFNIKDESYLHSYIGKDIEFYFQKEIMYNFPDGLLIFEEKSVFGKTVLLLNYHFKINRYDVQLYNFCLPL